jgi:hypothetical protein
MTHTPSNHPHVALSKAGDVLVFRGLDQPSLVIAHEDLPSWLKKPTGQLPMQIHAPNGLVLIKIVLEAGAVFSKLKTPQSQSSGRCGDLIRFDLPDGRCAVYINRDPSPDEVEWIRGQAVDIIVAPALIVRVTDNGLFAEMLRISNDHFFSLRTRPDRSISSPVWADLAPAITRALGNAGPGSASGPSPATT